jgi:hypothetical protein
MTLQEVVVPAREEEPHQTQVVHIIEYLLRKLMGLNMCLQVRLKK